MDDATVALRVKRHLNREELDNFGIFTSDTLLDLDHQATNGIFAVLVGVVALSLVVGGIVIMNIMLMVVTERTRARSASARRSARGGATSCRRSSRSRRGRCSTFGGLVGIADRFAASPEAPLGGHTAARQARAMVCAWHRHHRDGRPFFGLYPAIATDALDPIEALRL